MHGRVAKICVFVAAAVAGATGMALLVTSVVLVLITNRNRQGARKVVSSTHNVRAKKERKVLTQFKPGEGTAIILNGGVQAETVSDASPRVLYLHNLLTPSECEHIIRKYSHLLKPSKVSLSAPGRMKVDQSRVSLSAFLPAGDDSDDVLSAVEKRVAKCMDVDVRFLEPLQLLMYKQGHFYKPHYDWLEPSALQSSGQRTKTLLVYLNDLSEGETGGGTAFWSTRKVVRPACGNAITWLNTIDGKGAGHEDRSTLHSGEALVLKSSVKYVLNVWVRDKPYR